MLATRMVGQQDIRRALPACTWQQSTLLPQGAKVGTLDCMVQSIVKVVVP